MTNGLLHVLRNTASRSSTPNGAKLSEFLFIHLAIFTILAMMAITVYVTITTATFSPLLIGGLVLMAALFALATTWFFQAAEFADQHGRDLTAFRITSRVLKGERSKKFGVLIRPYSDSDLIASDALPAIPFGKILSSGPIYAGPEHPLAMESHLVRAMQGSVGPLISLGAPIYSAGAGRAPVSARDWNATTGELADQATIIFFAPGIDKDSKQALKELLTSDLIRRTIIIEPGAEDERHPHDVEADTIIRWNSLRSIFADHGYALPPKSEHGALIYYGVAGAEPRTISFGSWHTRHLKLFLNFVAQNAKQAQKELENRNSEDGSTEKAAEVKAA